MTPGHAFPVLLLPSSSTIRHLDPAVVAQRQAVAAAHTGRAPQLHVAPDQALHDRPVDLLDRRVFHDHAVLDAAAPDPAVAVDRCALPYVGVDDLCIAAYA